MPRSARPVGPAAQRVGHRGGRLAGRHWPTAGVQWASAEPADDLGPASAERMQVWPSQYRGPSRMVWQLSGLQRYWVPLFAAGARCPFQGRSSGAHSRKATSPSCPGAAPVSAAHRPADSVRGWRARLLGRVPKVAVRIPELVGRPGSQVEDGHGRRLAACLRGGALPLERGQGAAVPAALLLPAGPCARSGLHTLQQAEAAAASHACRRGRGHLKPASGHWPPAGGLLDALPWLSGGLCMPRAPACCWTGPGPAA